MSVIPAPAPARTVAFPRLVESRLRSGIRAIALEPLRDAAHLQLPLIGAELLLRRGATEDPAGRAGAASLTTSLMLTGTAHRGAAEIAQIADALGARLDISAGYDASSAGVSATTTRFAESLALLAESLFAPAFAADELERLRAKVLSDLRVAYASPSALARIVANRVIFEGSPYARPLSGTPGSIAAIERDDILAFHALAFRPDGAIALIGGDTDPDRGFALLEERFGEWPVPAVAQREPAPIPGAQRDRVIVVDRPDAGRAAIVIALPSIRRSAPNYEAAVLATAVLSGYSGRLNREVRVKRGLSYGAGAQLVARTANGALVASTLVENAKALEGTQVMLDVLSELARTPPSSEELTTRKTVARGAFARATETIDGLLSAAGEYALHDLPLADLAHYPERIDAVTADAIASYLADCTRRGRVIVIAGRAEQFLSAVRDAFPDVEPIEAERLDLLSPTLQTVA